MLVGYPSAQLVYCEAFDLSDHLQSGPNPRSSPKTQLKHYYSAPFCATYAFIYTTMILTRVDAPLYTLSDEKVLNFGALRAAASIRRAVEPV